ncbi:hypothetical protein [Microbacterium hominis]|uniref:Uncharacterized protein n=1 Tax=Microbacterium hominis TaxID=162426 RepID=A0A7D4PUC5_9MICO|nr:hypothetical protein [Microbacterium hominis]QKJ19633.1 hypothetical protein HQM25_09835 [Microbacterium hominis]
MDREAPLAWVESPLQLIGAAEWAAAHARSVPIAGRLTPQMGATADELIARGARFGVCEPYLGIPWRLLSQHDHWLVGDGFSGQFRLAAAVLRPRRITFLDDGANTIAFADTLLGRRAYARPGVREGRATGLVAPFALDRIARRARAGRADVFTVFPLGDDRVEAMRDRGYRIGGHRFEWTRRSAHGPAPAVPGSRVVLGSARPTDGRMPMTDYLAWVRRIVAGGPVAYLPHRREAREHVRAVAAIEGVDLVDAGLPVELVLAGAQRELELFTQPSSTFTTLCLVLAGTGSVIRTEPGDAPVAIAHERSRGRSEGTVTA